MFIVTVTWDFLEPLLKSALSLFIVQSELEIFMSCIIPGWLSMQYSLFFTFKVKETFHVSQRPLYFFQIAVQQKKKILKSNIFENHHYKLSLVNILVSSMNKIGLLHKNVPKKTEQLSCFPSLTFSIHLVCSSIFTFAICYTVTSVITAFFLLLKEQTKEKMGQ